MNVNNRNYFNERSGSLDISLSHNNGMSMNKPPFDSLQVCVEVPMELRGSLLCEGELMSIQDSLIPDEPTVDQGNIVIKPISQEAMEGITHKVSGDVHQLPYHIIKESLVSPSLSIQDIQSLDTKMVDFIFAEIYKINGFQCGP